MRGSSSSIFGHKEDVPEEKKNDTKADGDLGPEDLLRILQNPEMAALLKTLAKAMDKWLLQIITYEVGRAAIAALLLDHKGISQTGSLHIIQKKINEYVEWLNNMVYIIGIRRYQ